MMYWKRVLILTLMLIGASKAGAEQNMPELDHVFVIMMENHSYADIMNSPNAVFIHRFAHEANLATNYYAVGHPSLVNYLEVVGGSNFGVQTDDAPDWHGRQPGKGLIEPIAGTGKEVPVIAAMAPQGRALSAAIWHADNVAEQLARAGKHWKTYQEDLPVNGQVDGVNYSDGLFTDQQEGVYPVAGTLPHLYAVKHNPFAYFAGLQSGKSVHAAYDNMRGFIGMNGLYADLATGKLPELAFIVPNQCHDMHGMHDNGELCGNDDALIRMGDIEVQTLVNAIHASPAWKSGRSAIVLVWDENSYGSDPNRVVMVVDTNYGRHGQVSDRPYSHFSLLKTLEHGFGLPCINHACDSDVRVMTDLFD